MWLTGRLMPDFKTIANFRKDNSKAIRGVCRQFVVLCQQLGLFGESLVAIDGSKFKAVNNRDRNFTSAKLKRRMEEIESGINRYLTALDTADRQEPTSSEPKAVRLEEKIAKLKTQMKELQAIEIQLNESPDKQVSLTDPDARSMMTRGTGIVAYNVQTAVDIQEHNGAAVVHKLDQQFVQSAFESKLSTQGRPSARHASTWAENKYISFCLERFGDVA